jgi:hypothetical protein
VAAVCARAACRRAVCSLPAACGACMAGERRDTTIGSIGLPVIDTPPKGSPCVARSLGVQSAELTRMASRGGGRTGPGPMSRRQQQQQQQQIPQHMTQHVPQHMLQHMPQQMPQHILQRIPQQMPQQMRRQQQHMPLSQQVQEEGRAAPTCPSSHDETADAWTSTAKSMMDGIKPNTFPMVIHGVPESASVHELIKNFGMFGSLVDVRYSYSQHAQGTAIGIFKRRKSVEHVAMAHQLFCHPQHAHRGGHAQEERAGAEHDAAITHPTAQPLAQRHPPPPTREDGVGRGPVGSVPGGDDDPGSTAVQVALPAGTAAAKGPAPHSPSNTDDDRKRAKRGLPPSTMGGGAATTSGLSALPAEPPEPPPLKKRQKLGVSVMGGRREQDKPQGADGRSIAAGAVMGARHRGGEKRVPGQPPGRPEAAAAASAVAAATRGALAVATAAATEAVCRQEAAAAAAAVPVGDSPAADSPPEPSASADRLKVVAAGLPPPPPPPAPAPPHARAAKPPLADDDAPAAARQQKASQPTAVAVPARGEAVRSSSSPKKGTTAVIRVKSKLLQQAPVDWPASGYAGLRAPPVFRPSAEELQRPIDYIRRVIVPRATDYGLAVIRPPSDEHAPILWEAHAKLMELLQRENFSYAVQMRGGNSSRRPTTLANWLAAAEADKTRPGWPAAPEAPELSGPSRPTVAAPSPSPSAAAPHPQQQTTATAAAATTTTKPPPAQGEPPPPPLAGLPATAAANPEAESAALEPDQNFFQVIQRCRKKEQRPCYATEVPCDQGVLDPALPWSPAALPLDPASPIRLLGWPSSGINAPQLFIARRFSFFAW